MSEDRKKDLEEMVDILKDLDNESLLTAKGFSLGLIASQECSKTQKESEVK